ncbi:MAG: tetratricopeptide repeat protein [Oligoflexales bacterium]
MLGLKQGALSVDLIVSGNVLQHDFSVIHSRSSTKCVNGTKGFEDTYRSIAEIKATLRFTNAHSGQVIHLADVKGDAADIKSFTFCNEIGYYQREMRTDLMDEAEKSFKRDFLRHISYGTIPLSVTLFKVDDELLPELGIGNKFFRGDKLKSAAKMYKKAIEKSKNKNMVSKIRAHALFSYGIVMGYLGKKEAFDLIDEAFRLNPEPEYLKGKEEMSSFFRPVEVFRTEMKSHELD